MFHPSLKDPVPEASPFPTKKTNVYRQEADFSVIGAGGIWN
jgi:hypothetical protein